MKRLTLIMIASLAAACANTNCREAKEKSGEASPGIKSELDPMNKTPAADRVKVFKPDGSLQCGQAKGTPVAEMQKELNGLRVHSGATKTDGMMRMQLCGSPTGASNVYEIDRKDLEGALKRGFKEWTAD